MLFRSQLLPAPDAARGLARYLPLHTSMEVLSIAMAAMVFGIAWATQKYRPNGRDLVLGPGLLGVAILDMSHCLSYAGMPDFITPNGPEKAILFWLAARSLAALALLCAAFWPQRHDNRLGPRARCWSLACVLLFVGAVHYVVLLHPQSVPPTFIPGVGLTKFKIDFEYGLIAALISVALITGASTLGNSLNDTFTNLSTELNSNQP